MLTKYLKYFFVIFCFISYFIGFYFRENIAGGAEQDFINFTWPLIQSFKLNFFETIKNYGTFGEGSLPMFHIINSYLNPFTFSQIYFQLSISIISLLNSLFFSQILIKKYRLPLIDTLVYSSIFLILPFFRSSAFWGITENLGWLFLILSIKYFFYYENKYYKNKILTVFLICIFSSLALYTRPYLVFFPIYLIVLSFFRKDYFFIKFSFLFYFLFSLPGIILLYIWEGLFKLGEGENNTILEYHNPKWILKNLIMFPSIFLFYFIPFEFSKKNYLSLERLFSISVILIIVLLLYSFGSFDYLKSTELGGGAFLKANKVLFKDNLLFYLIISSAGILLVINYFNISVKNKILFLSLIIYLFPKFILQEYFEPLVILILFTLIDLPKKDFSIFNKNKTINNFIYFYIIYFALSIYYRYYIF